MVRRQLNDPKTGLPPHGKSTRQSGRKFSPPPIEIHMFEVQLGAAVLLQFAIGHDRVRILADAGARGRGYKPKRVHDKLLPILDKGGKRQIDLIIGTHYDEDHLNNLVPIINDETIKIGEAWMPPIANDTVQHMLDATLSVANLLPHQFYSESGDQYLAEYLSAKREDCELLSALEGGVRQRRSDLDEGVSFSAFRDVLRHRLKQRDDNIKYFRDQLAKLVLEDSCVHVNNLEVESGANLDAASLEARHAALLHDLRTTNIDKEFQQAVEKKRGPEAAEARTRLLELIRRSAAKDAINAKALHAVTRALRRRNIPVRSEIIPDGEPRTYAWNEHQFVENGQSSDGPELKLLGPSHSLVRKHWNKLPVEADAKFALREIEPISPSNQLSYIARIGFQGQGILITGDAGCVDFKLRRGEYYPGLLNAMLPLHIVQVAHHGGHNAHFYQVLTEAGFATQVDPSLLLLSHETNSKFRPSPAFGTFLQSTLKSRRNVKLVFTNCPSRDKVAEYQELIHPPVPRNPTSNPVGDVRIEFAANRWDVMAHAVEI